MQRDAFFIDYCARAEWILGCHDDPLSLVPRGLRYCPILQDKSVLNKIISQTG